MKFSWRVLVLFSMMLLLSGCQGTPPGVTPVCGFELNRYLGKWYEIARLDHSFERGLSQVSAEYSLRADGGVKVLNRGFGEKNGKWKQSEGRAYFVGESHEGLLKVSFFRPFYGSYVIFDLDKENYQSAFVCGPNTSYLWFLSRTPTVSQQEIDRFVQTANKLGFDTDQLIFPHQEN